MPRGTPNRTAPTIKEPKKVETPHAAPQSAGSKVVVACKMPNGMRLRLFKMESFDVPVLGGGTKTEKRAVESSEHVLIHGPAIRFGAIPEFRIVGGYALTNGVSANFWRAWLEANKEADYVANNIIFAEETEERAVARAKEQSGVLSGLQPMDMSEVVDRNGKKRTADKRMPRPMSSQVGEIHTAEKAEA